jgi:GT2 family glycosyltransferase
MSKTLAIVIPVWNNWQYTKKAIRDLLELPNNHQVIVVDNGSTDDTTKIGGFGGRVLVRRNNENLGFAKACNAGFALAVEQGFENVMFLNNDVKVLDCHDSWTASLISAAERGSIVGPTVGCLDSNLNFVCEAVKYPTRGFGYISGWCIVASVNTWQKLILDGDEGPFSTEFGFYFEDTDLGFRAKAQNIPCEVVPVPVKHLGKATAKLLGVSELYLKAKPIFMAKWRSLYDFV